MATTTMDNLILPLPGFRTDGEALAELMLSDMEAERDNYTLREMNGGHCAKRQVQHLSSYKGKQKAADE